MKVRYYVATECDECGEENIEDICREYGFNPGTDGHALRSEEEAWEWCDRMNTEQPYAAKHKDSELKIHYFPVAVIVDRLTR